MADEASKMMHVAGLNLRFVLPLSFLLLTLAIEPAGASQLPSDTDDIRDDSWSHIRGPNYDGVSRESQLADHWPNQGPPVLWSRPLGQGYSGFVAWEDRVATQYQTLAGQYVLCLDANRGKTLWEYRYAFPYDPASVYPGPRATPTYANGSIYFAGPNGRVGCLDATNGRQRWSVNIYEKFGSRGTGFGYSCSPTVVGEKVILPVGGPAAGMVALDTRDGSVVWQAGNDPASYTPAYPITFRDKQLVLGYMQNALVCHDLHTGSLVWRFHLSSGYDEHSAWPVYSAPYLWISSPFQAGSELLQLTDDPGQPIKTVRKSRVMSNDILSSVLYQGSLFGFDLREAQAKTHRPSRGQFRCIDFLTGDVNWSTGSPKLRRSRESRPEDLGARIGHANVLVADGKLILLNDMGELILAQATPDRYEELGRISVLGGEICWTQPTLHRGRLFVRNHSQAACLFLGEPAALDSDLAANASSAADIPQSEYVDWASWILSVEPEYAFDIPSNEWLVRWFWLSLFVILGGTYLLVGIVRVLLRKRLTSRNARVLVWTLAFVAGALGTTFLSRLYNDFIFTWPMSLYIAFQATACMSVPSSSADLRPNRRRGWLAVGAFALVCLAYFLICRRLSLIFEWTFLCGFPAALPVIAGAKYGCRNRQTNWLREYLASAVAFSSFYWFAVAVLWSKTLMK